MSTDDEFLQRLESEAQAWQEQGVVGRKAVNSILAFYGLRADIADRSWRLTRTTAIFAIFGAILIGVGIILFVASNDRSTSDLPRLVRVTGLVAGVIVASALGYYLRYETRFTTIGHAVLLLGAIMYGAAIFLAGQIYNVEANHPILPFYWFLGVLPLAYVTRSAPIVGLSLVPLAVWLGSLAIGTTEDTHSSELRVIRTAVHFLMLGVLVYFLAPLHQRFAFTRDMWHTLPVGGILFAVTAMFALTFRYWYDDFVSDRAPTPDLPSGLLAAYVVIAVLAIAAALGSALLYPKSPGTLPFEAGLGVALVAVSFTTAYVPFNDEDIYAVGFNILLFGTITGLIPAGLARRQEIFINAAMLFLSIVIVTRYFDLAWGLQERSLVFMGAGVIVLVGAVLLEYYRRRVVRPLREA